jgi:enoyl-CoA hydratase/carnithine racemase
VGGCWCENSETPKPKPETRFLSEMMITLCSKAMRRNIFQKCLLSTSSELRSDRFTETVEMNIKDRVAYLTLCRPEKRNALSTSALERLMERMEEIESSKGINVVVLQHLGPAFSSGHDLKEVMADEMGKEEYAKLFKLCSDAMMKISRSSKPVIAKVDGIATAAGCQLVASCDLAYSTEKSFFATPGVNIGLFCSTPAVALSRVLSRKHAMEMLLIGDMM